MKFRKLQIERFEATDFTRFPPEVQLLLAPFQPDFVRFREEEGFVRRDPLRLGGGGEFSSPAQPPRPPPASAGPIWATLPAPLPEKRDVVERQLTELQEKQLKHLYRRLALQYHPDRNVDPDAPEVFRGITSAFRALTGEEPADFDGEESDADEEAEADAVAAADPVDLGVEQRQADLA